MTALGLVTAPTPADPSREGTLKLARRGKSAIKRAAIVPGSRCADGLSGNAAISADSLRVAVSPGNRDSSAASSQGSTSCRTKAERTLSSVPFLSSPIVANRKLSNSDPSTETQVDRVMSSTAFCRLDRTTWQRQGGMNRCRGIYPFRSIAHCGVQRQARKLPKSALQTWRRRPLWCGCVSAEADRRDDDGRCHERLIEEGRVGISPSGSRRRRTLEKIPIACVVLAAEYTA